jgi:hypothetical protein
LRVLAQEEDGLATVQALLPTAERSGLKASSPNSFPLQLLLALQHA